MTALIQRPALPPPGPDLLDVILTICEAIAVAAAPRGICPTDGCLLTVTDWWCPACRAAGGVDTTAPACILVPTN